MRRLFMVALAAVATLLMPGAAPGQYRTAPWCAVYPLGDFEQRDCVYRSIEDCRPNVIAGNRGYCSPNPLAPDVPPQRTRRKRHG